MDPVLKILKQDARLTTSQIADRLDLDEAEVARRIQTAEEEGAILGYHAVVDPERAGDKNVSAIIEVKLTPEREGGFDRLAKRIAQFEQVTDCHLMSGGYDLLLTVAGPDLREVARFVSEKLSSLFGVQGTATHFQL
ncbi:MAG: Lrp/AsnC family transcriptional regulator [Verrucomicrobiota bacterium]